MSIIVQLSGEAAMEAGRSQPFTRNRGLDSAGGIV